MSRRRKKLMEIELHQLVEHPPAMRPKREASRVLDLLDRIAAKKPNKEDRPR